MTMPAACRDEGHDWPEERVALGEPETCGRCGTVRVQDIDSVSGKVQTRYRYPATYLKAAAEEIICDPCVDLLAKAFEAAIVRQAGRSQRMTALVGAVAAIPENEWKSLLSEVVKWLEHE